jgi:hypothetical protein
MVLQIIFGMTASSVSMHLHFGRRILIEVLKAEPAAAVMIPSETKKKSTKMPSMKNIRFSLMFGAVWMD